MLEFEIYIIETENTTLGRIEFDDKEGIYIKFRAPFDVLGYDTIHVKINGTITEIKLFPIEDVATLVGYKLELKISVLSNDGLFKTLFPLISDTIYKEKIKEVTEEWSDIYNQKPIEKDYLTDDQKDRLHKLLVKEIDKYFRSGKTRMSYADVIKIEEIIVNVLNGE